MKIDELTIGQVKEIQCLAVCKQNHKYEIGKNYFIRCVTMYYVGKLESVDDHEIVLSSASWVADTGRLSECLANGTISEVEPFPAGEVIIGRGTICDASVWISELPSAAK